MENLEFVVVKINNVDVTLVNKHEATQLFLNSDEPILLEVRRRESENWFKSQISSNMSEKFKSMSIWEGVPNMERDKSVYVDEIILTLKDTKTTRDSPPLRTTKMDNFLDFSLNQHLNSEKIEQIVEDEHNIFEQCLEPDIDVEEITLRKSDSNEHLGLTVCYSPISSVNSSGVNNNIGSLSEDTDQSAEVYISDIQPDSVAGRDGRLRLGDQILQINGKDIKNKTETEALIAENRNAVTLLVSRYIYGDDEYFNDHIPCSVLGMNEEDVINEKYCTGTSDIPCEDLNYISYKNSFIENSSTIDANELNSIKNLNEVKAKTINCPLDILMLKDEKPCPYEDNCTISSNEEIISKVNEDKTSCTSVMKLNKRNTSKNLNDSISLKITNEVEHIYETIPEDSDSEPFYSSPYEISKGINRNYFNKILTSDQENETPEQKHRVAQWLGVTNNPYNQRFHQKSLELLPNRVLKSSESGIMVMVSTTSESNSSASTVPSNTQISKVLPNEELDSTSALNTSGSHNDVVPCSSNCIALEKLINSYTDKTNRHSMGGKEKGVNMKKTKESTPFISSMKETTKSNQNVMVKAGSVLSNGINNIAKLHSSDAKMVRNKQDVHQFNAPNLSQYHFVSSQEVSSNLNSCNIVTPSANLIDKPQEQMVWKVKRRADGSRYIVRRPARKYILKEQPFPLVTSHHTDTTTEDDTISEVKLGRYWPKEERKKHIEKAKERRNNSQRQNEITLLKPTLRKSTKCTNKTFLMDKDTSNSIVSEQRYFELEFNSMLQERQIPVIKDEINPSYAAANSTLSTSLNKNLSDGDQKQVLELQKQSTVSGNLQSTPTIT